jgi:hypothetical protein
MMTQPSQPAEALGLVSEKGDRACLITFLDDAVSQVQVRSPLPSSMLPRESLSW